MLGEAGKAVDNSREDFLIILVNIIKFRPLPRVRVRRGYDKDSLNTSDNLLRRRPVLFWYAGVRKADSEQLQVGNKQAAKADNEPASLICIFVVIVDPCCSTAKNVSRILSTHS